MNCSWHGEDRGDLRGRAALRGEGPPKDRHMRERARLVEAYLWGRPLIVDVGDACCCLGYHFAFRRVDARMYLLWGTICRRFWPWRVAELVTVHYLLLALSERQLMYGHPGRFMNSRKQKQKSNRVMPCSKCHVILQRCIK